MTPDFRISKGNLLQVSDTLSDDNGAVNLTSAAVKFIFQRKPPGDGSISFSKDATIATAAAGQVTYTFVAGETDIPGSYQAQWEVTNAGVKRTFPTGSLDNDDASGRYIEFEIVDVVPVSPEAGVMLISETYEGIRAMLGDHNAQFRQYEDTAIASVVRTCLRSGKVPGYSITPNRLGITPAIVVPRDFGLLIHHAAKMFILPAAADYKYKTRAMSESFGDQRYFLQDLENALYDLENHGGVFLTFQSFYGWVNALTGMNIWSAMTDMTTRAPVANVTIGRDGITVNTT